VPWNFSLYGLYFLHSVVLSNLHALALKNRGCPEFTVLNVYFLLYRIFEQLALALKNRVAQKFFAVWKILFTFRIFEQLVLAMKNIGCPEFTILNVFFYYSGFLSNLRLP